MLTSRYADPTPPDRDPPLRQRDGRSLRVTEIHHCGFCNRPYRPKRSGARHSLFCRTRCRVAQNRRALRALPGYTALARAIGVALGRGLDPTTIAPIRAELDRLFPPARPPEPPAPRTPRATSPAQAAPRPARKPRTETLPWPRSATDGTPLGVDLHDKGIVLEVRKLVMARRFYIPGHDPEEILGEIVLTIWRRNQMPCAFDPRKSRFSHYVNVLAENVVKNMAASPKAGREQLLDSADPIELADDRDPLDRFESSPLWRDDR